jgi:arylsulfatase A-like enzyme
VAWGNNDYYQCDVGGAGFVAVAAGECHSLGLKSDGTIVRWGEEMAGRNHWQLPTPNADFVAIAACGEHGLGDKRSAYDESLRVPLLVHDPRLGARARGRVVGGYGPEP